MVKNVDQQKNKEEEEKRKSKLRYEKIMAERAAKLSQKPSPMNENLNKPINSELILDISSEQAGSTVIQKSISIAVQPLPFERHQQRRAYAAALLMQKNNQIGQQIQQEQSNSVPFTDQSVDSTEPNNPVSSPILPALDVNAQPKAVHAKPFECTPNQSPSEHKYIAQIDESVQQPRRRELSKRINVPGKQKQTPFKTKEEISGLDSKSDSLVEENIASWETGFVFFSCSYV